MSEIKKTSWSILALYMLSTTIFLSIIFGMWYQGELNLLKTRSFHEVKKLSKSLIYVMAKKGKYGFFVQSLDGQKAILQSISLESGYLIATFGQNGELVYSNMKIDPYKVPKKDGVYLIDGHAVLNSYGKPEFLYKKPFSTSSKQRLENQFRIIIDGGNIANLLWKLRLRIWGIFGVLLVMMGVVGFFLVRLALRPINQKIQELNLFIKDTTHEINTPLSVLQMSVDRIDKSMLEEKDLKKFHSIQVASKTLQNIYQSLIYTSFGRMDNVIETINMKALLEERLEFFEMLFEQKNITISTSIQEAFLQANPKSIALVLDNLLSNAYKYTRKKGEVKIILQSHDGDCVLQIQDNGYGIGEKDLNHIFERYMRFEKSNGGFGLGLNIVKKICEEFAIHITCESKLKVGTKFILQWKQKGDDKS